SRKIHQGIGWTKSLANSSDDVAKLEEKEKDNFAGPEVMGKILGVIGLGAIGMLVANAAEAPVMRVNGYDPYISVDAAWQLSKYVEKAKSLDALISESDYITLHVPFVDATNGFINKSKFQLMKDGARVLNFARGELVNKADML